MGSGPGPEGAGLYLEHARSHGDDLAEVHDVAELLLHVAQEEHGRSGEDAAQRGPRSCHVLGWASGDPGSILASGRSPGEENGNPLQYSCQENSMDRGACRATVHSESQSESCSVLSDSLQPHGLYSPWNCPGQNTEVGSLSLLQGIFSTQASNPGLPHCRQILYQLNHSGSPRVLE